MNYPKLIPVDAFPVSDNGDRYICLRDPQNRESEPVFISELAYYLLTYFDGKSSVDDVLVSFRNEHGRSVDRGELENLINELDKALLIDNERYNENRMRIERQFLNAPVRNSYLSGLSYPEDESDLDNLISGFYKKATAADSRNTGKLKGLISPHIDFNRGGVSYAIAYRELIEESEADTYLIFGTTHYARNLNPFILTKKSFMTPFGQVDTDVDFIEKLESKCQWDLFDGEIYHRNEHSIEFQVVFLKHLLKGKKDFKIIPILCNSFHKFVDQGIQPKSDKKINSFFDSLRETIDKHSGSVCIIAGVDMAHVGPKFGDPEPVDDEMISWIEKRDNLTLNFAEKLDADGFYQSVEEEKDKRKICGLSSIYSMLNIIDADHGKILSYDKALEPDTGSVVTFASAAFYK